MSFTLKNELNMNDILVVFQGSRDDGSIYKSVAIQKRYQYNEQVVNALISEYDLRVIDLDNPKIKAKMEAKKAKLLGLKIA